MSYADSDHCLVTKVIKLISQIIKSPKPKLTISGARLIM